MSYVDQKAKPVMVSAKTHLFLLAMAKEEGRAIGAMCEKFLVNHIEDFLKENHISDNTWEKVARRLKLPIEEVKTEW